MTEEKKLEELIKLEKARAESSRQLTLLIGGLVVIVLAYLFCF